MNLDTPLRYVRGIGPALSYKLARLELNTLKDLIYHFPFRYEDYSKISTAQEAQIGERVTLEGEIWSIKNVYTRFGKVLTQAIFNDRTNSIILTWFNQSWLIKQIVVGERLQISGKLTKYKNKLTIISAQWEKIEREPLPAGRQGGEGGKSLHTGKLVAVYPETANLTSKWFRTKIDQVLPEVLPLLKDPLPDLIRNKMLTLEDAIRKIHFPPSWDDVDNARQRLGFDELFYVSLATQKARLEWKNKPAIQPLKISKNELDHFISQLPFELTGAQKKVIYEIIEDLKGNEPMNRLIQGEVGSGKTVVAAIITYLVYQNKLKTLFMAPTEILAFQHYSTISNLLIPFGIKVGIYTGSKKFTSPVIANKVKQSQKKIASSGRDFDPPRNDDGDIPDVIIGTHALLSPKLNLKDVGLVIVDEQQRFGVEQRSFLRKGAKLPHFLTMTATPIPRTVALTLYGDLDLSIIDELPKNRIRVKTFVVPAKKRQDAYKFIEKKVKEGDQVYIITPLIELSETLQSAKAAKVEFERLQKKIFPTLKLGLLHGRLKSKEKEEVMQKFKGKEIDILVSTSVVEVGMDVTNATIMMIESAERFGLAQLHQLRGRVGRGGKQSYCFLFAENEEPQTIRRLKHLQTTQDGLKLSELDLKIRGSGEIFGVRQSGRFEFKIASLSDLNLVEKTRKAAAHLLSLDPALDKYPLLQAQLRNLAPQVMPD